MREEDIDWKIYHIIIAEEKCMIPALTEMCGFEKETVLDSLKRLEKNCLIETKNESARILSLQETILRNSVRSAALDTNSPVIIENGIIKANPNYKGKF